MSIDIEDRSKTSKVNYELIYISGRKGGARKGVVASFRLVPIKQGVIASFRSVPVKKGVVDSFRLVPVK